MRRVYSTFCISLTNATEQESTFTPSTVSLNTLSLNITFKNDFITAYSSYVIMCCPTFETLAPVAKALDSRRLITNVYESTHYTKSQLQAIE